MQEELTSQPIADFVWDDKYRWKLNDQSSNEKTPADSKTRMVKGVYAKDPNAAARVAALEACLRNDLVPAGRIQAGAGTDKLVTLLNCYVAGTIPDSMLGIMEGLSQAALTQQQGGGIGMDFSTLRPNLAIVKQTGSISTGVLPFMDMWDAMCKTIKSSGSRRGAMMGVMAVDHPDVMDFIVAKRQPGRLVNFNVSVAISNSFMAALQNDEDWELGFRVPPADPKSILAVRTKNGEPWYVYRILKAKELWEEIMKNTYDYAEPGVLFMDRINELNNLRYCEQIAASNPCGEQPLPPYGACDLIQNNMVNFVNNPFTDEASIDYARLRENTAIAVRFADNVLDVSNYPLKEQALEAFNKRRLGIGQTGVGNMLQMCKSRYGSPRSVELQETAAKEIALGAYWASMELAKERGPFPLYDRDAFLKGKFIQKLKAVDPDLVEAIAQNGIRNGVLLSDAPCGTISPYIGNVSSGIEPTFEWEYYRKVLQQDNSFKEFKVYDYGWRLYKHLHNLAEETKPSEVELPDYMTGALQLSPEEHIAIAGATQTWVDAAISKTINIPKDYSYEAFSEVYMQAWDAGMKGCTTYRPSGVRGAVLSLESQLDVPKKVQGQSLLIERPEVLLSTTYKIKWPHIPQSFYVTISDYVDDVTGAKIPFEIFIMTKSVVHQEWITALTRTISAVFRKEHPTTTPHFGCHSQQ
ncbi:MAG: adenosylcobalamin-dependent ribonucleoside-diphosphate reductase [Bryocella sp.]